jgi:hypothetical protein
MKSFKILSVYDLQWHGLATEFHKNRVLQKFWWDTCQCVSSYRMYFYLRLLLLEFLYIYASTLFLYNCIISRMNKEPSIISGTGPAIWSKLTLGLLTTITLNVVPFCSYVLFPVLLPFLNASCKSCSVRGPAQSAILPRSPQLCQNGSL